MKCLLPAAVPLALFSKTKGSLDADGRAAATIVVPKGLTAAVGLTMHFATWSPTATATSFLPRILRA